MEQTYEERILEGAIGRWGHVNLHLSVNGIKISATAHHLVLLAFKGERPAGKEACHNNGNASDNRPDNLRWDTHFSNNQDRKRHGRYAKGLNHPMGRLSDDQVAYIRSSGKKGVDLARDLNISPTHISKIRLGHSRNA